MNKLKRIAAVLMMSLFHFFAFAQNNTLADEARKTERMQQSIYIVMAVAITILLGLFIYVFSLDRKISKLEKGKL